MSMSSVKMQEMSLHGKSPRRLQSQGSKVDLAPQFQKLEIDPDIQDQIKRDT